MNKYINQDDRFEVNHSDWAIFDLGSTFVFSYGIISARVGMNYICEKGEDLDPEEKLTVLAGAKEVAYKKVIIY